jgi:hypothetical protein
VELHIARIMSLYGVPKKIVSDRGTQFTSRSWEKTTSSIGYKVEF